MKDLLGHFGKKIDFSWGQDDHSRVLKSYFNIVIIVQFTYKLFFFNFSNEILCDGFWMKSCDYNILMGGDFYGCLLSAKASLFLGWCVKKKCLVGGNILMNRK